MSTKKLARGYGALSAAERFALATAAAARGDEVEAVRLQAAARPLTVGVTDQFGYTLAFTEVAKDHWAVRLHAAALLFRLRHLADTPGPDQERSHASSRVAAHLLRVYADGWALFCRRAGLDPAGGEGAGEWEDTVLQAEAEASAMGVTDDEAVALAGSGVWLGSDPAVSQLKSCETVAADLRQRYLDRLAHWGAS